MDSILIIDDDPQLTHLLSLALSKKECSVDIAYTPESVLEYIKKGKYDLILQDIFYPNKEDGFEIMETYFPLTNEKNIPIVLMTAMPFDLFQQEANFDKYLFMAKLFISKSDDMNQIVDRVMEIIAEQKNTAKSS